MRTPPRIETLYPKLLVGMRREMSHAEDTTPELWRAFGPRIREVENRATDEMIAMRLYLESAEGVYDPDARYSRWAALEVTDFHHVPDGMETYRLDGGTYAVFVHRGPGSDVGIFQHIFGEWLPESGRELAHREHLEILPAGYDPRDPDATEEIWIPIEP